MAQVSSGVNKRREAKETAVDNALAAKVPNGSLIIEEGVKEAEEPNVPADTGERTPQETPEAPSGYTAQSGTQERTEEPATPIAQVETPGSSTQERSGQQQQTTAVEQSAPKTASIVNDALSLMPNYMLGNQQQSSARIDTTAQPESDTTNTETNELKDADSIKLPPDNLIPNIKEETTTPEEQEEENQNEPVSATMQKGTARLTMEEVRQNRNMHDNEEAQNAVMEASSEQIPRKITRLHSGNRRFAESWKRFKERSRRKIAKKGEYKGNTLYETIVSYDTIMPNEVSIGTENLLQILREPNSTLLDEINELTGHDYTRDDCIANPMLLMNAINLECDYEVAMTKTPVNTRDSIQIRTLRIHPGRGIGLHPTQSKQFNADFDGDPASISMDRNKVKNRGYGRAMTHLIGVDGKPTIDADFFPLDPITEDQRSDVIKCLRDGIFANSDREIYVDSEEIINVLFYHYKEACNNGDWLGFFKAMDKFAGEHHYDEDRIYRDKIIAYLLKGFYDYSIRRRGYKMVRQALNYNDTYDYSELENQKDPRVLALVDMVEDIANGVIPPNFSEFTAFMHKQFGDFDNKNLPFRLLADFAKAIKRTDLITVGSAMHGIEPHGDTFIKIENGENVQDKTCSLYELWQVTIAAGEAKLISGRINMGSTELAVSTAIKTEILKKQSCRPPQWTSDPETNRQMFVEWMQNFQREYNYQMHLLNSAQFQARQGMKAYRENAGRYDGFEEFDQNWAKAVVEIFGDFSVERIFPNVVPNEKWSNSARYDRLYRRYGSMSVAEFSMKNKVDLLGKYDSKKEKYVTRVDLIKESMRAAKEDPSKYSIEDFLYLVADRKTKQEGEYGERFDQAVKEHFTVFNNMLKHQKNRDYDLYLGDVIESFNLISPDMFYYFGMDSPLGFLGSKYGKKLLTADSPDAMKSIFVSMLIEYRFSRPASILRERKSVRESDTEIQGKQERLEELDAVYANEINSLSSSSLAWEVIIREMENGDGTFHQLLQWNGESKFIAAYGKRYKDQREYSLAAKEFWKEAQPDSQYSLLNFLKSEESFETKMKVLRDVIAIGSGGFKSLSYKDMIGMLVHNPEPLSSGSVFDPGRGLRPDIDAVKASIDRINGYKNHSIEQIKEDASKIIDKAKENKEEFETTLKDMADHPWNYCYVDPIFAIDAISSVYDKNYSDSEKIKQQTLVNAYFEMLSIQRSGGFYTHFQQTDNSVLNVVGYDQLTPIDIIRIIGNPSIKLHGYDEFGRPCTYSRADLCGGETIEHVLSYLEDNPRIALAFRTHLTMANADKEGTARINAANANGIIGNGGKSNFYQVFSLLNDRPRFLAVSALLTSSTGNVGRNMPKGLSSTMEYLCNWIAYEATQYREGKKNEQDILDDISKELGISEEAILEAWKKDSYDPTDITEEDRKQAQRLDQKLRTGEYDDNVPESESKTVGELFDCIEIIKNAGIIETERPIPPSHIGIDKVSLIAFFDVIQQMCGARTAKMIGVEGAETKKNLILKQYVIHREDRYMTVSRENMSPSEIHALQNVLPEDFKYPDGIHSLSEWLDSEPFFVIKVPTYIDENGRERSWTDRSMTLEHSPKKILHSIARFLEVKREYGAEKFNAKTKKYGDDGTNSITKFFKYTTTDMAQAYGCDMNKVWTVEDGANLRDRINACTSREDAVEILAYALIDADRRLGYIEQDDKGKDKFFNKSDYYNRADLMIAEYVDSNGEQPVFYIRTLEQLSKAFNSRLSDDALRKLDNETAEQHEERVLNELKEIDRFLGTPADPQAVSEADVQWRTLNEVRIHSSISKHKTLDRAIRPRSSSTERNWKLINRLYDLFCHDQFNGIENYTRPSREEINKRSQNMYRKLSGEMQDRIRGIAYPHNVVKKNDNGDVVRDEYDMPVMVENPNGSRQDLYDYLGRPQDEGFVLEPGPQNLVLFDTDPEEQVNKNTIKLCEEYGITVAFPSLEYVPLKYVNDILQLDGMYILPFFDMALNGSKSNPITAAPSVIPVERGNFIVANEDTEYAEIAPGDASGHVCENCANRIEINFDGQELFGVQELFPNATRQFADYQMEVQPVSYGEILEVLNQDNIWIEQGGLFGSEENKRAKERFDIRVSEYLRNTANKDQNDDNVSSWIDEECTYDSIVGWVKLAIDLGDRIGYVYAPIIPFDIESTGKVPVRFKVTKNSSFYKGVQSIGMNWKFTGDIRDQYIKYFEGIGASNKLIVNGGSILPDRELKNGLKIDILYSTSSIASRLSPDNKRINAMMTMMIIPWLDPAYAYNFADLTDAFPDNTLVPGRKDEVTVKELLAAGKMEMIDWVNLMKENPDVRFHNDDDIDSIVRYFVNKCIDFGTVNPSMLLATKTTDGLKHPLYTEYEAFLDNGYNFQNALMKFMHAMNRTLVADGIEGSDVNTLFKTYKQHSGDQPYGMLQMMVPHYMGNKIRWTIENIYISLGFFGDEFSGFKRVNFDASQDTFDDLNTAAELDDFSFSELLGFGRSSMTAAPSVNTIEASSDNVMKTIPIEERLNAHTVAQLKSIAKELNIKIPSKFRKADIVELLSKNKREVRRILDSKVE